MKRDMELCRKILLEIEEKYEGEALFGLPLDGYELVQVGEHCKMMYEYGLISEFKPINADGAPMLGFFVGSLTWEGHDFLDSIREDTVWSKTKDVIKDEGLPMILSVIRDVATAIITSMTEGAIRGLKG